MLNQLRSRRGGICYIKSDSFRKIHYVDHDPIFVCHLVPSHMITYDGVEPLNTELGRGLIRREALDLLAYSYTETETGSFLISGHLELVSERLCSMS